MAKYVDIDAVKEAVRGAECDANWDGCRFDAEFIENALDFIPAADVAPVVYGHFIHDGSRFAGGVDWWHCSNCGKLTAGVEIFFNYCPYCGARMNKRRTHND